VFREVRNHLGEDLEEGKGGSRGNASWRTSGAHLIERLGGGGQGKRKKGGISTRGRNQWVLDAGGLFGNVCKIKSGV
jgi:hypothetical protein